MSLFKSLALLVIAGSGLTVGLWWGFAGAEPEVPETPLVSPPPAADQDPLRIVVREQGEQSRAYVCHQERCRTANEAGVSEGAVTDGESWYFYETIDGERGTTQQRLVRRTAATGEERIVIESTSLTTPRGLTLSPDGSRLAFWLDNVANPKEELTELWVYDVADGGVRLLAEKLYRPDVRSDVHWNAQSTQLILLIDTGEQDDPDDHLRLARIDVERPGIALMPEVLDAPETLAEWVFDVSATGDEIAYAGRDFLQRVILQVVQESDKQHTAVQGSVPFIQFLEDGDILYAVQDPRGFTFWRRARGVHRFVARRAGQLESAASDATGGNVAFTVASGHGLGSIYALHVESGAISEQGRFTSTTTRRVAHVRPVPAVSEAVAGIVSELDDAQLVAFVERNLDTVVGSAVQPSRLLITDEPNTLFIEYRESSGVERRLLLTVRDAIHADWSIRARYEPVNREWRKTQGGGLADPTPLRLYEWEESLEQWILKEVIPPQRDPAEADR